jgi:hypothetical protein
MTAEREEINEGEPICVPGAHRPEDRPKYHSPSLDPGAVREAIARALIAEVEAINEDAPGGEMITPLYDREAERLAAAVLRVLPARPDTAHPSPLPADREAGELTAEAVERAALALYGLKAWSEDYPDSYRDNCRKLARRMLSAFLALSSSSPAAGGWRPGSDWWDDNVLIPMARAYHDRRREGHPAWQTWEDACKVPGWLTEQCDYLRAALAALPSPPAAPVSGEGS